MPDFAVPPPQRPSRPGVKRLSLALQGGGAHGAFTWGVMHRLMSDPRLYIDGISGASAGAMNAVVFADGFRREKRQGAIDALERFWMRLSDHAPVSPWSAFAGWFDKGKREGDPVVRLWTDFARLFSPTQLNPFDVNPLRDVLRECVDFEGLRQRPDIKLFVTASNVRTCRSKIFRTSDLTADILLASACLPLFFRTVMVDGEPYWDGGYLGNPAIEPLIAECYSSDILLVPINPMRRDEVPVSAPDILNRINEMSFNSSLVQQMLNIATLSRLVEEGALDHDKYTTVRFHRIEAEEALAKLGALSRVNVERDFLRELHNMGFDAADRWLEANFERIGWESTLDVLAEYG